MAGPLNGLSQQVPLATTFQPSQNSTAQVRPEARQAKDNTAQARNAPAASSLKSETRDQNSLRSSLKQSLDELRNQIQGNQRGSVLDITV